MSNRTTIHLLGIRGCFAFVILTTCGCATVENRKVPTPAQFESWTDAQQKTADAMEGFRYYLPRPYVNVFRSFPIGGEVYIAHGVVSPDGQYVTISAAGDSTRLSKIIATKKGSVQIPAAAIQIPVSGAGAQSGTTDDSSTIEIPIGVDSPEDPAEDTPVVSSEESESDDQASQPTTGINQRAVTNDNAAFAYQPLRGNFDIVYLPDFDEQYVITSKARLGNATFSVNMGQGWSLQGFNSLTDNSELTKRVFKLIDIGLELSETAARRGLDLAMPGAGVAADVADVAAAQSATTPQTGIAVGSHVALRITIVHYASAGLYPVIKPREFLKVQEMENGILKTDDLWDGLTGEGRFSSLVPVYPYQHISFNTFPLMAIELIKTSDTPFLTKIPATGVEEDQLHSKRADFIELLNRLYPNRSTGASAAVPDSVINGDVEPGNVSQPINAWVDSVVAQWDNGNIEDSQKVVALGTADGAPTANILTLSKSANDSITVEMSASPASLGADGGPDQVARFMTDHFEENWGLALPAGVNADTLATTGILAITPN